MVVSGRMVYQGREVLVALHDLLGEISGETWADDTKLRRALVMLDAVLELERVTAALEAATVQLADLTPRAD
jgi:hypothetical protein